MCGIVGIAAARGSFDSELVVHMRDTLRHRGPDDAGAWWSAEGSVALGHRRLSILDLSPAGHQPMSDARGELHVVFNGEIYNFAELRDELAAKGHAFRSRSDTEVLLAAYREWGTECLARLNGMFAFGMYDARSRRLFLARDRAGEKPLFYTVRDGSLRFASEIKALLADPALPRRIDREGLDCYLAVGYTIGDQSMVSGVKKLPPGHALTFDLESGQARSWRYWKLPEPDASHPSETELLDELEALLADSVRRQLVADVPVGVLLSGGVDSSVVTAFAARATPHVKTFTMRFPGHGSHDETEHARLIARHFATDHIELEASPSDVELLPMLAHHHDDPIGDSSMIPTFLISRLTRQYCTVALGGDGGDELFAGYKTHRRLLWTRDKMGFVPRSVRGAISKLSEIALPVGMRGRMWLQGLGADWDEGLPVVSPFFDRGARRALLSRWPDWPLVAEEIRGVRIPRLPGLLQRITRMDFETYLPDDILAKVDRASMASSLEVRAPLLDHRIIEFAFRKVPPELRASATTSKVLLKKLAARILPAGFDMQRKQGFSIPLSSFLKTGPWRRFFHEVLLDPGGVFDRGAVEQLLHREDRGFAHAERLFALVMFELWRREFRTVL